MKPSYSRPSSPARMIGDKVKFSGLNAHVERNRVGSENTTMSDMRLQVETGSRSQPLINSTNFNSDHDLLLHFPRVDQSRCLSTPVKIWGLIALIIGIGFVLVISGVTLLGKPAIKASTPGTYMITDKSSIFDDKINREMTTTPNVFKPAGNPSSSGTHAPNGIANITSVYVSTVKDMLRWIDTSVQPCDNFYEFACKGWQKQNKRPDGTDSWSVFQILIDKTNEEIKVFLQQNSTEHFTEPEALRQVKTYFKSCLEGDSSTDDFWDVLNDYGGWPLLSPEGTWNSSKFDWMKSVVDLKRRFDTGIILNVNSIQNQAGNAIDSKVVLTPTTVFSKRQNGIFSGGKVELNDKPFLTNLSHPAVTTLIVNISRELLLFKGETNINETYLEEKASSIIQVQQKLLQVVTKTFSNIQKPLSGDMTLSKLQSIIDAHLRQQGFPDKNINWKKFLSLIYSESGVTIEDDEPVHVSNINYLLEVSVFVSSLTPEELANLLHFHMAVELASLSTLKMQGIVNMAKGLLDSQLKEKPRSTVCSERVQRKFPDAVGYAYIKYKYPDQRDAFAIVNETNVMFTSIKQHLKQEVNLSNSRYFIPHDIEFKTENTSLCAGFPQWIYDSSKLKTIYYGLKLDDHNTYLQHHLAVNAWSFDKDLRTWKTNREESNTALNRQEIPSFKCNWKGFVGEVGAYNNIENFAVYIPMGILQAPYFNIDYPRAIGTERTRSGESYFVMHLHPYRSNEKSHLEEDFPLLFSFPVAMRDLAFFKTCQFYQYSAIKFGKMGTILGHEMTHSLGTLGWTNFVSGELNPNAACFASQYDNLTGLIPPEVHASLNGTQTLSENIPDNVGLLEAYKAYKYFEAKVKEIQPPELSAYTNDQLFFLSFAQNWCESNTAKGLSSTLRYDTHSAGMFRVIGSLTNSNEFVRAWNCPVGSKMNPAPAEHKKCSMF